jgi:hypothetical protein
LVPPLGTYTEKYFAVALGNDEYLRHEEISAWQIL